MALSRGSHVRVPKPIFSSQVAPMDQRAGPVCVRAPGATGKACRPAPADEGLESRSDGSEHGF